MQCRAALSHIDRQNAPRMERPRKNPLCDREQVFERSALIEISAPLVFPR